MNYRQLIAPIYHLGATATVSVGDFARCSGANLEEDDERPLTVATLKALVTDPDALQRVGHLGEGNILTATELRNVFSVLAFKEATVAPVDPQQVVTPTTPEPEPVVTTTTPEPPPPVQTTTTPEPSAVVTTTTPAAPSIDPAPTPTPTPPPAPSIDL